MARYKSDQPVYLSDQGRYIMPGEEFTGDYVPGSTWEPLDDDAKAAIAARDKAKDDAPAKTRPRKPGVDDDAKA